MTWEQAVEFGVLGPLVVRIDTKLQTVTRAQGRLLALLLCRPNEWVRAAVLADMLWGNEVGNGPARLHVLVHRLRKALGETDRIPYDRGSYRVEVAPGELDADQFTALRRAGEAALSAGALDEAVRRFREADQLWRGEPFAGLDDSAVVAAEANRLRGERLAVLEDLYDAELRAGSAATVVTDLANLAAEYPLRERLTALLVLGLHQSGQRAEALAVYGRARARLIEELGIEPGPDLRQAQAAVLADGESEASEPAASEDNRYGAVQPRQLPPDPTGMIGRSAELSALTRLVDGHVAASSPLVIAIDGPAGIGKTTFAVHAAHLVHRRYQDGQIFIDLHGYSARDPVEPSAALRTVLQALGVPPTAVPAELDEQSAMLRSYLAGKRLLILLDNARSAEQVRPLLPAADCLLLVTSRNQLRGLTINDGARRITLRPLDHDAAGGVLAAAVGGRRADGDPAAVALLARLCGRIPLALRIAGDRASRFPGQNLAELAAELSDERQRLDRLGDADDQAADLRAAFSWSYRTLPAGDARTFRLLGLQPAGTISLPAVAALTGSTTTQVRRSVDRLVALHLLEEPQPGRFRMHDLLRLYAAELLAEQESTHTVQTATGRLLDWYLGTAAAARDIVRPRGEAKPIVDTNDHPAPGRPDFGSAKEALDWFETEQQALADLVQRAAASALDVHAWKLVYALQAFYMVRLHLDDWHRAALAGQSAAWRLGDDRAVLFAETNVGIMHLHSARFDASRTAFETALEMAQRLGDDARHATSLSNLGLVAAEEGDHRRAVEYYEQASVVEARVPTEGAVFTSLLNLSASQGALGNYQEAIVAGERAVDRFRRHGNSGYEALALSNVAEGHLSLGDLDRAQEYCEQALELFASLDAKQGKANALVVLGRTHRAKGALDDAERAWTQAEDLFRESRDPRLAGVQDLLVNLRARRTKEADR